MFLLENGNPVLMIDPDGMRTTHNWDTDQPVRYLVEGVYIGIKIKVITTNTEIITAFPIK